MTRKDIQTATINQMAELITATNTLGTLPTQGRYFGRSGINCVDLAVTDAACRARKQLEYDGLSPFDVESIEWGVLIDSAVRYALHLAVCDGLLHWSEDPYAQRVYTDSEGLVLSCQCA